MNILFLTMSSGLKNIDASGIYTDLMRKFRNEGHEVYIIYPRERRFGLRTEVSLNNHVHTLGVKTLNLTKTNVIEKGIGQILLEYQFMKALKTHYRDIEFDLILYSTPPITFTKVISYVKRKCSKAISYLLLKDIFPQNAVDLGMLSKSGLKGLLYKYFRAKERKLYHVSDYIGCMSPANVQYIIQHNPDIDPAIVEVAPNSYDKPINKTDMIDYKEIRSQYGLPLDKPIFIYGGNMGKPQGISFLIRCLDAVKDRDDCHFVVVGDGTEYSKLDSWYKEVLPLSVSIFRRLPKVDYDNLARACDVGMIFLDYRFSIPNYPSRLLPYIMERKPIIAVTDPNCDTGYIAETNGYGYWCPSNSVDEFILTINKMLESNMTEMGRKAYNYFLDNYTTDNTFNIIMKHLI